MNYKWSSIPIALSAALVAGMLLTGVAGAAPGQGRRQLDRNTRVHPKLQYGADAEPNKKVRVLVQKTASNDDSRDIARRGAATVREDFSLGNTTSMEISQKDLAALAKDSRVLYVSPDGLLRTTDSGHDDDDDERDHDELEALTRAAGIIGIKKVKKSVTAPKDDQLQTTYPVDVKAESAWASSQGSLTGAGVTVAVLDTGINPMHPDLQGKVFPVFVNPLATGYLDDHGHGTHVAGIINGRSALDRYVGIAPDARVISVKIADDNGAARESDMLRGLDWVYQHRLTYNIKVVNLSVSAATPQSYRMSPINASVERLWQAGVTVITSAGNRGTDKGATWFAPGNDPFAVTVGCIDDNLTTKASDDSICSFSSRGRTQDGFAKPDLMAPGRRILAPLTHAGAQLALEKPDRVTADGAYLRLSGTSQAAPVVTGATALLLQRYPNLKPNQVKYLLTASAQSYSGQPDKAGQLNIAKLLETAARGLLKEANQAVKLAPAVALFGGGNGSTVRDSSYWDSSYWDSSYWDSSYWDSSYWDSSYWDSSYWDSSYWDSSSKLD